MRLRRRIDVPAPREATEPVVVVPRHGVVDAGDLRDITCGTCRRTIAYGVLPERVEADVPFFLEQHRPFCGVLRL